jgi:hypothetical protein
MLGLSRLRRTDNRPSGVDTVAEHKRPTVGATHWNVYRGECPSPALPHRRGGSRTIPERNLDELRETGRRLQFLRDTQYFA